ncbi:MAG: heavy metal transporter [Candidatus Pacebacteria bacterium]|nr:heavy metal transporter [Candidatus Paceibacterota bacterium]PIR60393.1 MAG: heavy metal transporter [Candidatus Pacebacteria bacterium CG10_big_fil_rev_8_21_14_0_10_44_54]
MFNFLQKKPEGEQVLFAISGMHCVSCGMNIDGELEEIPGVVRAETSYAKGTTTVIYDAQQVGVSQLQAVIAKLGYTITKIEHQLIDKYKILT